MFPSVSTASATKPYSPTENLGRKIFPPAFSTRPASTAQSLQAKYTSVLFPDLDPGEADD